MASREEVLSLHLSELGVAFGNLRQFKYRKFMQKSVYFLQEEPFGADLGFFFSLYIHGPYSTALAETGYELLNNPKHYQEFRRRFRLTDKAKDRVTRFKKAFKISRGPIAKDTLDLLEVSATIHLLYHGNYSYLEPDERIEKCREWIRKHKRKLLNKVDHAVKTLGEANLLQPQE